MALKKRIKASAQFSMSSLTDIIFLLLIFFMLTSSLVAPNAINLKMPGRTQSKLPPASSKIDDVRINDTGTFLLNGRRLELTELEARLRPLANQDANITISPDSSAPVEAVVAVMDIAMRLNINGILLSERK
ncbi:MAG TPA: biopolymer transporter ExbD [Saprospiraceae bacterium]|nr:biopolymer transporter ExbD [Saprospiraceae bacterium]HMP14537.1 biopolymer transporter ExbD [Saprospiraceae bacterium]